MTGIFPILAACDGFAFWLSTVRARHLGRGISLAQDLRVKTGSHVAASLRDAGICESRRDLPTWASCDLEGRVSAGSGVAAEFA